MKPNLDHLPPGLNDFLCNHKVIARNTRVTVYQNTSDVPFALRIDDDGNSASGIAVVLTTANDPPARAGVMLMTPEQMLDQITNHFRAVAHVMGSADLAMQALFTRLQDMLSAVRLRDGRMAEVHAEGELFVARCLENDVTSQGPTRDAAIDALHEALRLFDEYTRPVPTEAP